MDIIDSQAHFYPLDIKNWESFDVAENRTNSDQYLLRFPAGMRDRLKDAAEQNNRSMNAEILARLEWSFAFEERYGQGPERGQRLSIELQRNALLSPSSDKQDGLHQPKETTTQQGEEMRKTIEDQSKLIGEVKTRMAAIENAMTLLTKSILNLDATESRKPTKRD